MDRGGELPRGRVYGEDHDDPDRARSPAGSTPAGDWKRDQLAGWRELQRVQDALDQPLPEIVAVDSSSRRTQLSPGSPAVGSGQPGQAPVEIRSLAGPFTGSGAPVRSMTNRGIPRSSARARASAE